MGNIINKYPYTDMHELNLDWILEEIKKLHADWDEFKVVNTISFGGDWNITKSYQAWTLVSDNGSGYISIKAVPAGVSLTNEDYWRLIADYGSLLAELQNRVIILEGEMDAVEGRATTLENDMDAVEGRATTLESDMTAVEGRATTLEGNVSTINGNIATINTELSKKAHNTHLGKFLLIGDSYAVNAVVSTTWCDVFVSTLGLSPDQYQILGYGGYGFIAPQKFIDAVEADLPNITDKDNIYNVIICGGANDVEQGTSSQLGLAFSNFKSFCKTYFPNATLSIGFIAWSRYATKEWNTMLAFYKNNCKTYGIQFLEGAQIGLHYYQYLQNSSGNYHHPTATGSGVVGRAIVEALFNGIANSYQPTTYAITKYGKHYFGPSGEYLNVNQTNDFLNLWKNELVYGNSSDGGTTWENLPQNTEVRIGNLPNNNWLGTNALSTNDNVLCCNALFFNSNDNKTYPVVLKVVSSVIYLTNLGDSITAPCGGKITGVNFLRATIDNYHG